MRQIGNAYNDFTVTLFENQNPFRGLDTTSLDSPLALDPADSGIDQAVVDVDLSNLHSKLQNLLLLLESNGDTIDASIPGQQIPVHQPSIDDWLPKDFSPFKSSLVPFDSDAGGRDANNQDFSIDSDIASVNGHSASVQIFDAPLDHIAIGNPADAPDAVTIAANAAPDQIKP